MCKPNNHLADAKSGDMSKLTEGLTELNIDT